MKTARRLILLFTILGVAALAAPALASADTFCVNAPSCPAGGVDEHGDLQKALGDATSAFNATVLLGDNGSAYVGPFSYPFSKLPVDAGRTVDIKAVGPTRPVITGPAGSTILTLNGASLSGVDVKMDSSDSGTGIQAGAGTNLNDVHVTGPGPSTKGVGINVIQGPVSVVRGRISGTGGFGIAGSDATVNETSITGVARGVQVETLNISASRITGNDLAVGGSGSIVGSLLQTTSPHSFGVETGDGAHLTLDHDTIVHPTPVDGTDAAVHLINDVTETQANLSAVVMAGYTRGILRDNSASLQPIPVTIRDSVWDSSHDIAGLPSAGPITESGDAHVDPGMVDLAHGDFRLRGSSAAIDRDTRTTVRYADINGVGAVDGDGNGTALADAGAFEYRRQAPSIDSASVPGSATADVTQMFSVVGSDADGDHLQTIWAFGDGGVGVGDKTTHAYAAPGIYTVTLKVVDEAGLSVTRTFTLPVTGGGGTFTLPVTGGGGDHTAPQLTNLRLAPNPLKLERAKRLRLHLTVSEPSTVRIVVRKVTAHGLGAVRGSITKQLATGQHSLGLAGGLRQIDALRRGRWSLAITATDHANNDSVTRRVRLTIRR